MQNHQFQNFNKQRAQISAVSRTSELRLNCHFRGPTVRNYT